MRLVHYIIAVSLNCFCLSSFSQISVGELGNETASGAPVIPQGDPAIDRVISIVNEVEQKENFIDNLTGDSTLTLPCGIIKQIGAARYVIAIDSMRFEEKGAYFSAYAAIDFPGTSKKLALAGSLISFTDQLETIVLALALPALVLGVYKLFVTENVDDYTVKMSILGCCSLLSMGFLYFVLK